MQQLSEQQRIDAVASHIKSIIELLGLKMFCPIISFQMLTPLPTLARFC